MSCLRRQETLVLNQEALLNQLEELAEKLGIEVCHENLAMEESSGTGGICRIAGKYVLYVHSRATMPEKIRIVAEALRKFDLENIYIKPALRELLKPIKE